MFRPSIILALIRRQVLLFTRNPVRSLELFFWPVVQLFVWGFTSTYIQQKAGGDADFQQFVTYLIGGIILWDALFRSQQGVAISFLEDVWTRNLLNVFAAPIRMTEYLTASFSVGMLRVLVTGVVMALIALVAYSFNLLQFGFGLVAFYLNLMAFGWVLGLVSTSLILRYGHAAESLAWAVPFMIQPFACVFYALEVLPGAMKAVALAMPPAHVFEGMRGVLVTGEIDTTRLLIATGLNCLYLIGAGALFTKMLNVARREGLLVKTASN